MNVLITGGAGFIGSHLADRLLKMGHEVFVIDDLSTGSVENVKQHQKQDRFHLVIDTILNESVMNELVFKCDQIYHMAAAVGVKLIMEKPIETLETNVKGTEIIFRLADRYKKKILIASTSEVYGKVMESNDDYLHEDADSLMGSTSKRRWAYACSKALDEFLAFAYFEERNLSVVTTRLFNTVGPRQTGRYGMVIPNFVQKALKGDPIVVYGDGTQSRSFSHVLDVVEALTKLMSETTAEGQVFNVGGTEEITIKDLASLVKKMTFSKSKIEYMSYEKAFGPGYEDMRRRCPDTSKLSKFINFTPKSGLEDILQDVINYYGGLKE